MFEEEVKSYWLSLVNPGGDFVLQWFAERVDAECYQEKYAGGAEREVADSVLVVLCGEEAALVRCLMINVMNKVCYLLRFSIRYRCSRKCEGSRMIWRIGINELMR